MHRVLRRTLTAGAVALTMVMTVPATAGAAPPTASAETYTYLRAHPGGTLLDDNTVSYGNGTMIVTVSGPAGTLASPDCPAGWFCFYDRPYFGYPRGKLSSCGWQNLATWGWADRVDSVYYNLDRGSVQFFDGSTPIFRPGVANRSISDVGTVRNRATEVYRYC